MALNIYYLIHLQYCNIYAPVLPGKSAGEALSASYLVEFYPLLQATGIGRIERTTLAYVELNDPTKAADLV